MPEIPNNDPAAGRNHAKIFSKIKKSSKILKTVNNIFFGDIHRSGYQLLLIYIAAISVLELSAYQFRGIFSIISSRIWLLGGLFCLIAVLYYFMQSILSDLQDKEYLPVLGMLLLILFLILLIGNVNLTEINPDAAQQAASGMDSFKQSDLNYTGRAFLGYPNRQYIITAIPAFFFGRSIATLQLGFALPFILGMILLYCGLRMWARKMNISSAITLLPIYALFVFPFVTEYYINFEQAIYPVSFTMAAIGFFLIIVCRPNLCGFLGLSWTGCLLGNCYTPALAALGLLIVFLFIASLLWMYRPDRMPFPVPFHGFAANSVLMVNFNILVFSLAAFLNGREEGLTQLRGDKHLIKALWKSIYDFMSDKNARFLGMFGVIVIIYMAAGLCRQLKIRDFLISLWILGVIAAADLLVGYTSYEPAWVMQRALIIIPAIITGVTLTAFDMMARYKIKIRRGFTTVILFAFAFIGIYNFRQINQSFTYFNYIQPMKYMLSDLEKTVHDNKEGTQSDFNLVLYTDNILYKNLGDYSRFLFPNAKIYTPEYGEVPEDLNLSRRTYVYCDRLYDADNTVKMSKLLTFEDKRYNLTVNWFKGNIRQ